jgi:hypothetical protein
MDKKLLIGLGGSICAVVLLVLSSLSNVVGYQSDGSPALFESPLFSMQRQRRMNHQWTMLSSQYLGKGMNLEDDMTPPDTLCILDPSEPDGDNGWYVSIITVILNATDTESGVNRTEYQLDGGSWQTYTHPFNVTTDNNHLLKYRSIDNAGNIEPMKSISFALDRTKPVISSMSYNVSGGNPWCGWVLTFSVTATDASSGMNRAEFFKNDELRLTIVGPGPSYIWDDISPSIMVRGFIRNPEITEEYVKFYARIVMVSGESLPPNLLIYVRAYDNAGNWMEETIEQPSFLLPIKPGFYFFQDIILPNNYTGFIGKSLIYAIFNNQ